MMFKIINTIKLPLIKVLVKLVNQYAEDAVNFVLRNIPEPIPILSGIQLNLTLLELPAITGNISHQIFDGTFLHN